MDKILSFFTAFSLILTYIFGFGTVTVSDGYEICSSKKLDSLCSLASAQGLCCDGEYFYCSGAISAINLTGLAKYDTELRAKKLNFNAIPKELTEKYGSDHLGGIDCADGFIYAPAEGKIDGKYVYNLILLFDCETLEYTGKYYDVSNEKLTDGIPWLAIDRENRILYTSKYNGADRILKYKLDDMTPCGEILLSETVNRIQGGSVYNGMLYLSYDVVDSTDEQILRVDLSNGNVSLEFERHITNYDNEAEDICVYPLPDGSLFHTLDYDKLVSVNIMSIKPTA